MKAGSITIKIKTEVTLLTILKWRLLGMHIPRNNIILPEGYESKNGKLFKVGIDS